MSSVNTQLFTSLKTIRTDLGNLQACDTQAITKIGAGIEHLMLEYDAELAAANNLLMLCLQGLQRIYQDDAADFAQFVSAISAGLVATEQGVASRGNPVCEAMVEQASRLLQTILGDSVEADSALASDQREATATPLEASSGAETPLDLALKSLAQNLAALTPEDPATIVQVGAGIENLITEYETDVAETAEVFMLCLAALQKMYHEPNCDYAGFTGAIGKVIAVAGCRASSGVPSDGEKELNQAKESLQSLLAESGETPLAKNAETSASATASSPEQTEAFVSASLESLDDISSLLIQIGAEDRDEMARICDALKEITNQTESSEHRKLLVKAARDLSKVVKGKSADADAALAQLGDAIAQISSDRVKAETAFASEHAEAKEVTTEQTEFAAAKTEELKLEELKSEETAEAATAAKLELVKDAAPVSQPAASSKIAFEEDNGLLIEFIVESRELIEAAESSLLSLENDPEDVESINTVFRAFHSVKGTSTFLGLNDLTKIGHHAESLLSRMRDREIRCTGGYANLALRSVDVIKEMLRAIEDALPEKPTALPADYEPLMRLLMNPEGNGITAETNAKSETAAREASSEAIEAAGKKKSTASDSSVRVRTDRLDNLIDMVGELVIAQSMLAQDSTVMQGGHHELSRKISHAGKIVRELQDLSMAMRMIPLKNTFQKMARIVRDVAQKCGKQIEFVTVGEDTEIDRNMVDIIADPLVHMVRNAADHGVERPGVRTAAGKSPVGKIKLSAYHAGGDVVVELTDDGAGLDRDKILAKAIALNLVESDKGMSENQIFNLIFAPGFSTADEITDVSGRGVGMDVVRRNIEGMRGRIEISSEKGKGSLFTIRLPLTLAITDGMLVRVGAERFIVPTINIHLSFRPTVKMLSSVAGRGELVSLRGELMPVFRLHSLFEVENAIKNPTEALLMIVADGRRRCALMVDELLGQQQVVAKTLGQGMGKVTGVSGGAILGDGCVGLILDLPEIVALARQAASPTDRKEELYQQAV